MGDLYPVIEGPAKFRDGKKVRFFSHLITIVLCNMVNVRYNNSFSNCQLINYSICIFFSGKPDLQV